MPQINSHNIFVGSNTFTPEMLSDIKNCDFYVRRELVSPIKNKVITIKECSHKNYYAVHINYVLFDRIIKITKIINTELYNQIIKTVETCETNRKGWWEVAEDEIVEEFTTQLNRDILMQLKRLGEKNHKSNGKFDI